MTGLESPILFTTDLSGPDYISAPLSATQEVTTYSVRSNFTVTFDAPVTDLLLYTVGWRGTLSGVSNPAYDLSEGFEVISGLGNAMINANLIVLPNVGFGNGIAAFSAPVLSFTVTTNATEIGAQGFTFGLDHDIAPIPLPATGLLLIGGLAGLAQLRRLSRRG